VKKKSVPPSSSGLGANIMLNHAEKVMNEAEKPQNNSIVSGSRGPGAIGAAFSEKRLSPENRCFGSKKIVTWLGRVDYIYILVVAQLHA
jgi:hypothetical protein